MSETAETVTIPPTERKEITKMADAFRDALKKPTAIAPAEKPPAEPKPDPASKPAPKPPEASPTTVPKPAPVSAPATDPVKPSDPEPEMPKNAKDWKAFKELKAKAEAEAKAEAKAAAAERDALKAEHAAQKAELETLKKGSAEYERVKAEFDGTKKQLEEFQGIINRFALEQDPRFQNHYNGRIKSYAESIKGFLSNEAAAKVDQVFALPPSRLRDEQVKAMVAELDETDRVAATAISNAYVNMAVVEREKAGELAKSAENLAQARALAQKQQQEEQAARDSRLRAVVDLAHQQIAPELNGAEEAEAVAFKEMARKLVFGTLDQNDLLTVVSHAAKGRKYDTAIAALKEENAKLQSQVAELTASNIPTNGTGGGERVQRRNGPPDNNDIGSKYQAALAQRQGRK